MDRRVFLGWEEPLLGAVVDWLWQRRAEMPGMLVVVPTAQAGRRLREALAERGGCLAPKVVTPGFFSSAADGSASGLELRYAWSEVLRAPGLRTPALFPVEPVERSFSWAMGIAEEVERVRRQLADEGLDFEKVAEVSAEGERWRELALLEAAMRKRLAHWERGDPLEADGGAVLPVGVARIVVAGVADVARPALGAFEKHEAAGVSVTVLVHAPEEEREGFDGWGQPTGGWVDRPCPVALERIHVAASPPDLAERVVVCLSGRDSDEVAVGLCDPAFGPALESRLEQSGWEAWNPEGRTAGRAMILMLKNFAALASGRQRWEVAAEILRSPLLERILGARRMHAALVALDRIEARHLPDALEVVKFRASGEGASEGQRRLGEVIEWVEGWRDRFGAGRCAGAVREWVREMQAGGVADDAEGKLYEGLIEAAEMVGRLEQRGAMAGPGEALESILGEVEALRTAAGREAAVVDLAGWLELPYERAGKVVLAGMHQGQVPDLAVEDAFLSDRLRSELGMPDRAARFERDAYLFHALAAAHEVDVVVAKVDAAGEPRRPSQLLLGEAGDGLAKRVKKLFGEPPGRRERLEGWSRGGWKLEFDGEVKAYLDGGRTVSPTALSNYLFCPFRFYLSRVLKWERHDAGKLEMDAMDFGNACHEALEKMAREMPLESDAAKIAEFLHGQLDDWLARHYGRLWSLPLRVQREAARTRLERFARIEAAERCDGWVTKHAEFVVGEEVPWAVDGQSIRMQIDRIDFHETKGWRVMDYKTSAKAKTPVEAHLGPKNDTRRVFGPEVPGQRGSVKVWDNVQLPLYAAFVKDWLGLDALPQVGYVNLPATLNDVGFSMWHGFDESMAEGALACAAGAIGAMRERVHWAPVTLRGRQRSWDDFEGLAPDGLEQAVGGTLIEEMKQRAEAWKGGEA